MQFLVISRPKESLTALPAEERRQLLENAFAVMKQQKKEGHILQYYHSPADCSVVILDVASAEDWVKRQLALPILRHYTSEIYPLADFEEVAKTVLGASKAAATAAVGASR